MGKSTSFFNYWNGYDRMFLLPQQVHADWGKNPNAIDFTNFAFNIYYRARKGANRCSNAAHKQKMIAKLEDAAREGSKVFHWGDLETAFEKLSRPGVDRGQWTDSKTLEYRWAAKTLPVDQTLWTRGNVKAPYSMVSFLMAMDKNIGEFGKLLQEHISQEDAFIGASADPRRQWNVLGSTLSHIKDVMDKASYFLWVAPNEIQKGVSKSSSFLSAANTVHGFGSKFLKYQDYGYSTSDSIQGAVVEEVLGYLPILGGYYAAALDLIPNVKAWFLRVMKEHERKIDAAMNILKRKPAGAL